MDDILNQLKFFDAEKCVDELRKKKLLWTGFMRRSFISGEWADSDNLSENSLAKMPPRQRLQFGVLCRVKAMHQPDGSMKSGLLEII